MGTMFEKGQTKRYSRVAAFSEGKEVKRKRTVGRKKPDEQLALEADNRKLLSEDVRNRFRDIPGSLKDAGERIMRELKPTIDEVVQSRPAMRKGGKVESKKMMAKEVAFMKKKKAPKSMIAHEEAEMKPTRMAAGGRARPVRARSPEQRRDNRRRVAINRMNRNTAPERPAPKNRQMPSPTELRNMTPAQRQRVMRSAQNASRNQPTQQRPSVRNALRNMSPEQRRGIARTTRKTRQMPRPSDPRRSGSKARPMPRPGTRPNNQRPPINPRTGRTPRPGTRPNNSRDPRTGNGSIAGLREGARPKNRQMPRPGRNIPKNRQMPRPGRNIPKNRQMPTPRPGTRPTNPRPGASRPTTPREAIAQRQAQRAQVAANRAAIAQRQAQRQEQRRQVAMNRVQRGQPASVGSNRNPLAGLTLRSPVTTSKAGGAVKTKKYAGGGMIPTASKKSPNSMGTPYSAGGRVKGKAMDGCATKGRTRGRTM